MHTCMHTCVHASRQNQTDIETHSEEANRHAGAKRFVTQAGIGRANLNMRMGIGRN